MNKENKVISLELAKKIHDKAIEKGFELPESEMYWAENSYLTEYYKIEGKKKVLKDGEIFPLEVYPAYDIAELGKMLKKAFDNLSGTMINDPRGHYKRLWQRTTGFEDEAEARGNLCFYLLDNDLL